MSLIDTTYFIGEITLPQISQNSVNYTQGINQYEPEILTELLGYELYSKLIADLENGSPQEQRFKDLVNGKDFDHVFRGKTFKLHWAGLVNTVKLSLIADYCFYKIVEREASAVSSVGVVKTKGEGSISVDPINKMCNAWNRMIQLYGEIPPQFRSYFYLPGFGRNIFDPIPCENLGYTFVVYPSAYNFLFANKTIYPEWVFIPKFNINRFGI